MVTRVEIIAMETSALLNLLVDSQAKRRSIDKESALLKVTEENIQDELIKRKVPSGTYGTYAVTTETDKEVPFGSDWAKITAYIKETGSVDLLEKRLLKSGVKARWADGVDIPGVTKLTKTTVKVERAE